MPIIDMADLPVQLPQNPADAAAGRARFFNSGNAFNIKLPPVPTRLFTDEPLQAEAEDTPTGLIACDQSDVIGGGTPSTTPLLLARYARIRAGETLSTDFIATGAIWYVIDGNGTSIAGDERIAWAKGDVFLLPGLPTATHHAETNSVLWVVTNEPQLALDGSRPPLSGQAVHYPAAEIERQLAVITAAGSNETTSGHALIFSSDGLEVSRNILPSLTLSLNTLPPGAAQRAHRHNSAAITLILRGPNSHSMVDGIRAEWREGATMVTPAGAPHSHHNGSNAQAWFLIVQDGGLYYHARTMGFVFLEED